MSMLIDFYSETNKNVDNVVYSAVSSWGQSITGSGLPLGIVKFFLKKTGTPTGTCVAKLYAHSGTFGTSSVPTGGALATSYSFNVANLKGVSMKSLNKLSLGMRADKQREVCLGELVKVKPHFFLG